MEFPNRVHNRIASMLVPDADLATIESINKEMDTVASDPTHIYLGGHDPDFGEYIRRKYGDVGWKIFIAHLIADRYATEILNTDDIVNQLQIEYDEICEKGAEPPYYLRE